MKLMAWEDDESATDLTWTSSLNLIISSTTANPTSAFFNSSVSTGNLNAQFSVHHDLPQFFKLKETTPPTTVKDVCSYIATKNVQLENGALFVIYYQIEPCAWDFSVWASSSHWYRKCYV